MAAADGFIGHTFVVPAYGDSPLLGACLDSILRQTRKGSELYVTTSTPSAYLRQIVNERNVPLFTNPRRASIGCDWNFALGVSATEFVTIAHQDDTYREDYVERMTDGLRAESDVLIAFSDFVETSEQGDRPLHANILIKRFLTRRVFGRASVIRDKAAKQKMLAWGNPVCCPSVVLNRRRLGHLRFDENLHSNLDWEAWRQLTIQPGGFLYVRENLVKRHIHTMSETTALIANHRRLLEDRLMFGRFWPAPVAAIITAVYRTSYRANRL